MSSAAASLRETIGQALPRLLSLDDRASARRPAPGKWSPREIIGHLIDSASNNHQRFVRATMQDDLVFAGYAQDEWVALQRYQDTDWRALLTLWVSYNLHLARVMECVPESALHKKHRRHNLHEIAWQPVPESEPATLDYFMHDYVAHMRHHLDQISR